MGLPRRFIEPTGRLNEFWRSKRANFAGSYLGCAKKAMHLSIRGSIRSIALPLKRLDGRIIAALNIGVHYAPLATEVVWRRNMSLRATSGLMHRSKFGEVMRHF